MHEWNARDRAEDRHSETGHSRHGLAALALRMMTRSHVTDLMAQHAGQFRFVAHQREQPATDVNVAARERQRVDDRRVEHGEGIGDIAAFGLGGELVADGGDVGRQRRIIVGATEGFQQLLILLAPDFDLIGGRHHAGKAGAAGGGIGAA